MKIHFNNLPIKSVDADEFIVEHEGAWITLYNNNLIVGMVKASDVVGIYVE